MISPDAVIVMSAAALYNSAVIILRLEATCKKDLTKLKNQI